MFNKPSIDEKIIRIKNDIKALNSESCNIVDIICEIKPLLRQYNTEIKFNHRLISVKDIIKNEMEVKLSCLEGGGTISAKAYNSDVNSSVLDATLLLFS